MSAVDRETLFHHDYCLHAEANDVYLVSLHKHQSCKVLIEMNPVADAHKCQTTERGPTVHLKGHASRFPAPVSSSLLWAMIFCLGREKINIPSPCNKVMVLHFLLLSSAGCIRGQHSKRRLHGPV